MRVTDLDKFALEEVWRPYQSMMGYETRLTSIPVSLEATALLLEADSTGWADKVLDRLFHLRPLFPNYIVHPLVDAVRDGIRKRAEAQTND